MENGKLNPWEQRATRVNCIQVAECDDPEDTGSITHNCIQSAESDGITCRENLEAPVVALGIGRNFLPFQELP